MGHSFWFLFFVVLSDCMCCFWLFNQACRTTGTEHIHNHSILNGGLQLLESLPFPLCEKKHIYQLRFLHTSYWTVYQTFRSCPELSSTVFSWCIHSQCGVPALQSYHRDTRALVSTCSIMSFGTFTPELIMVVITLNRLVRCYKFYVITAALLSVLHDIML